MSPGSLRGDNDLDYVLEVIKGFKKSLALGILQQFQGALDVVLGSLKRI